jgi:hypothetical protein
MKYNHVKSCTKNTEVEIEQEKTIYPDVKKQVLYVVLFPILYVFKKLKLVEKRLYEESRILDVKLESKRILAEKESLEAVQKRLQETKKSILSVFTVLRQDLEKVNRLAPEVNEELVRKLRTFLDVVLKDNAMLRKQNLTLYAESIQLRNQLAKKGVVAEGFDGHTSPLIVYGKAREVVSQFEFMNEEERRVCELLLNHRPLSYVQIATYAVLPVEEVRDIVTKLMSRGITSPRNNTRYVIAEWRPVGSDTIHYNLVREDADLENVSTMLVQTEVA